MLSRKTTKVFSVNIQC